MVGFMAFCAFRVSVRIRRLTSTSACSTPNIPRAQFFQSIQKPIQFPILFWLVVQILALGISHGRITDERVVLDQISDFSLISWIAVSQGL